MMLYVGLLNEQGEWSSNENGYGDIIKRFYESLFTLTSPEIEKIDELLIEIQPIVTEEMNTILERTISIIEIKKCIFHVSGQKPWD